MQVAKLNIQAKSVTQALSRLTGVRFCTAMGVWRSVGVIPKLAGAFCLCDWIISITYLVSAGYLKYDRFSVFFICKYLPEDHECINIAQVPSAVTSRSCDSYIAINLCLWQNKSQIKTKQSLHQN